MIGGRRGVAALFVFAALWLPLSAHAWNAAGHRLSAYIAWQLLDESTRGQVSRILESHPDHGRWIARAKDVTPDLAAFLEASTWPDEIKGDPRFYDADEDRPTTLLSGLPDMQRHRHWHYINRPLGRPPKLTDAKGELDRQLSQLINSLASRNTSAGQRAYALPWVIHLVADAHQPLHTVSRYDAEGRSDEGGNLSSINHPFHPRHSSMNLHTYWDDLPGPPWLRGRYLEGAANRIIMSYPSPPTTGTVQTWIDESWQIARESAYPPGNEAVPTLSAEFHEKAQAIARKRVAEAGYRLAALLQDLLNRRP